MSIHGSCVCMHTCVLCVYTHMPMHACRWVYYLYSVFQGGTEHQPRKNKCETVIANYMAHMSFFFLLLNDHTTISK